jgi:protein O-GlcNAc transferase
VEHCQQALSLNPQLPAAHNNLGTAFQELGNLEAAISHYSHAIRLKPDYALAHWNLATAFKERGDLEAAIAGYQRALAPHSSDVSSASSESKLPLAQAWNDLTLVFHEQGRLEEAIACYRHALAHSPDFADAGRAGLFRCFAVPETSRVNPPLYALALLLAGDLPAGFAEYEWRGCCHC